MRRSPLWMVTQEPRVTALVSYLQASSQQILGGGTHRLRFVRSELELVREAFARMIRRGESKLHHLGGLLSQTLFGGPYELDSVVIGQVEGTRERFTLMQTLTPDELYGLTDLDLGTRQLARLRFADGDEWRSASLVANFVEYQPQGTGNYKIITRIKAEEEIWNKVVDEIFDLDQLVSKDKQLREYSRYVKDIFGLKIVVGSEDLVRSVQEQLVAARWSAGELGALGIPLAAGVGQLEFVEVKDYAAGKQSGWKAMKSVVRWWDDTFEIQVQPLRNYLAERERLTRESHASFRLKREDLRNQVAESVPLFGFYRDLLRWLFLEPDEPPPSFPSVVLEVLLEDPDGDPTQAARHGAHAGSE